MGVVVARAVAALDVAFLVVARGVRRRGSPATG
jgi:hypothetical protein